MSMWANFLGAQFQSCSNFPKARMEGVRVVAIFTCWIVLALLFHSCSWIFLPCLCLLKHSNLPQPFAQILHSLHALPGRGLQRDGIPSHARSSNRKKRLTNKCTRQAHSGREHHDIIMTYRPEPWDCPTHTFDFLRVSPSYPNHAQNHTSKSVVFSLFPRCSAINRLWVPKLWSINGIVQLVQIQRHRAAEITWQAPELDPT